MDKATVFLLNVCVNSLLTFCTTAALIEGFLFVGRIPQGRLAAFLRLIPMVKLPLDLCRYDFTRWAYLHGINPWDCPAGTRTLSVMLGGLHEVLDGFFLPLSAGIEFTVPGNMTFSLADLMAYAMGPRAVNSFALLFASGCALCWCIRWRHYFRSISTLRLWAQTAQTATRKSQNMAVNASLRTYRLQVLMSSAWGAAPCVAGLVSCQIYISARLSQILSRKEYDAVLAHEIEHVRCKDHWVRLLLDIIAAIFWWVPTTWLYRSIEEGQEVGCDLKCAQYGVDRYDLATAMLKSAQDSLNAPKLVLTQNMAKNTAYRRIDRLLTPQAVRFSKLGRMCAAGATLMALAWVLPGRFWIF